MVVELYCVLPSVPAASLSGGPTRVLASLPGTPHAAPAHAGCHIDEAAQCAGNLTQMDNSVQPMASCATRGHPQAKA